MRCRRPKDPGFAALPGNCICIADHLALGDGIISDLAGPIENSKIKKVLYDDKTALSFLCASEKRTLEARNIFDLMLASEIC